MRFNLSTIVFCLFFAASCSKGGGKKNTNPAAEVPNAVVPVAEVEETVAAVDPTPTPAAGLTPVEKSTVLTPVSGSLALSGLSLTGFGLLDAAPTAISCVDALDGTVYDASVALTSDGSFTCPNVPKCYSTGDCADANPVQTLIVNADTGKTICVASAGENGLVCDVAGCLAAAITEAGIPDAARQCLTDINMAAAAGSFQQSLNKAYKMGEIALDRYTLEECLGMNAAAKIEALDEVTKGSLAEVVIASMDSSMRKEVSNCADANRPLTTQEIVRDFLGINFGINLYGGSYDEDKGTAGTMAYELEEMKADALALAIAAANGQDPSTLVANGTITPASLKFQYIINCGYFGDEGDFGVPATLNAEKTAYADCPATMTRWESSFDYVGMVLGTKISYPNINDPQGLRSGDDKGGGGPGFPYAGLKKIAANPALRLSLQDIYNIFFVDDAGLKFRMRAGIHSGNENKEYIIGPNGDATEMTNANRNQFVSNDFAPTMTQVFGLLTNRDHPYDLKKLLSLKVHRGYNPTGQEFFYVAGKSVDGKVVPVSCDILDASGKAAGLNIATGVTVSCTATGTAANMKRYFVGSASNSAYLRLINKDNGQEVRTADQSPVFLQELNAAPGSGMPTCTAANQVSLYKYQKAGEHDGWLDGKDIRTVCVDFASLRNPVEYYLPFNEQKVIGQSSHASHVLAGMDNDGEVVSLCLNTGALTVNEVFGCFNPSTGAFVEEECSGSLASCDCSANSYPRSFDNLTTPGAASLTLVDCDSSNSKAYYLQQMWEPGPRSSEADLKVALIKASSGDHLQQRNTGYSPGIVDTYIAAAFAACKTSKFCWRNEDVKDLAAHSDIASEDSWMKADLVRFYCHENFDNEDIRNDCAKLEDSSAVTLSLDKFANAKSAASSTDFKVFENNSYFSHLQQPNPGYNRVFDFDTFTFKYANYDPYCDDIDGDGKCSFSRTAPASERDIFLSDIWRFDERYALYSPVANIAGFTHDTGNALFPAEPSSWVGEYWTSYVNPVFEKIGGPSALACSNDRSVRLTWQNMQIWQENTWRTGKEDACGSNSGYFVVRNIKRNKNSYLIEMPDYIQSMLRIAFGTLDKRAVPPTEKRFDFIQALAVFVASIDVPPATVSADGDYVPFFPTIDNRTRDDTWTGFSPMAFDGDLSELINLFITYGQQ